MQSPLQVAVRQHKWEAIPLLQGADKEFYEEFIINNLDIVSRVNAFLRMFKADEEGELENSFQRGFIVGIIVSIMAGDVPSLLPDVMVDTQMILARLSLKGVNIMNGGELHGFDIQNS